MDGQKHAPHNNPITTTIDSTTANKYGFVESHEYDIVEIALRGAIVRIAAQVNDDLSTFDLVKIDNAVKFYAYVRSKQGRIPQLQKALEEHAKIKHVGIIVPSPHPSPITNGKRMVRGEDFTLNDDDAKKLKLDGDVVKK